jgi:hypothetical protein
MTVNRGGQVLRILKLAIEAKRSTGKAIMRQLVEIIRLRFSYARLGATEYYLLQVYRYPTFTQQRAFVGWRMGDRLQRALTSDKWYVAAADKFIFGTLCEGFGLPYPQTQALFVSPNSRHAGRFPVLANLDEVRAFLTSTQTHLPIWIKPVRSWLGFGGVGIKTFDPRTDIVTLVNEDQVSLCELFKPSLSNDWPGGYLFQKLLRPHEEIVRRCGNRLCTVRMWVLLEKEGPRLLHAILKVVVGKNMIDNLMCGTGNSYGSIDVDAGVVVRQTVLKSGYYGDAIYLHPDTGEQIVDFQIPDWEKVKRLCFHAALCFGGFRFQGWDIALTDQGPVLVELNCPGDITMLQIETQKGLWDSSVDKILDEIGATP